MREHLYKAKRIDNNEWAYGSLLNYGLGWCYIFEQKEYSTCIEVEKHQVDPETICEYTGCSEFVLANGYGERLFENDIVETLAHRSVYGREQSKYDGEYKVRGIIKFERSMFRIDYDNEYNNNILRLRGDEENERHLGCYIRSLYETEWLTPEQLKWQQEHNPRSTYHNIVRIGNIFDNPELLNKGE